MQKRRNNNKKKGGKYDYLLFKSKSFWDVASASDKKKAFEFAEGYKKYLNESKTERRAVVAAIKLAKKAGYKEVDLDGKLNLKDRKLIFNNRNKNLVLVDLGEKDIEEGIKMLLAHVDSPHLDLKVRPLYEDSGMAYLKSYYYGGIKKYHWLTIPLMMVGMVVLDNGEEIEIRIGEKKEDPIFLITDLLPHLDTERIKKTVDKAFDAEELNIVVGSIPVSDKDVKDRIKLAVLEWLYKNYKIKEDNFVTADIRFVPNYSVRDVGFDRGLLAGYGHDDRVCVYASLLALLEGKNKKTSICYLADKEEISSEGPTSAKSPYLENVIDYLIKQRGSKMSVYDVFRKSKAISADTGPAYDPDYKQMQDERSIVYLSHGLSVEKHLGVGGKYFSSEAEPRFVREIINIFRKKKVVWQTGHAGKIDTHRVGGTISVYLANRNIEVLDVGIPVLNLHAPYELVSKGDLYSGYKGYKAFLEA